MVVGLAIMGALGLAACRGSATGHGRPTSEIAFSRGRADNNDISDIYVIKADGSGQRRLVPFPAGDPAWSSDGRRIAFTRFPTLFTSDLYIVNADGSGLRQLTRSREEESSPVWSPDGRRIAVVIEGEANSNVTYDTDVVNADGSGRRRLAPFYAGEPSWSPDGRRIAFTRLPAADASDVYVVNADGSRLRRLTRRSANSPGSQTPAWSPDGRRIAFANLRVLRAQPEGPFVGSDIYVINADGSGRRRLTKSPPQSPGDLDPVWSPDGRQITFVRQFAIGATPTSPCGRLTVAKSHSSGTSRTKPAPTLPTSSSSTPTATGCGD